MTIQRGNNRQAIFTCDKDLAAYAHWLAEGAHRAGVAIHGWGFMTNHVHLLVTPIDSTGLSWLMQYLGRLYVRYFNYAFSRSGTLFEGRFKTCRLWSPHRLYLQLASHRERRLESWRALLNDALKDEALAKIRHCANTGLVLGTETFKEQVHRLRN